MIWALGIACGKQRGMRKGLFVGHPYNNTTCFVTFSIFHQNLNLKRSIESI